jgi:endoglucanase
MLKWLLILLLPLVSHAQTDSAWIRINQLGYTPAGIKVAVWCSKQPSTIRDWQLIDVANNSVVFSAKPGKPYGTYGPFKQTYRLNFSAFKKPGRYYIKTNTARSPEFDIKNNVYDGAADFCLRYMRQQRSGFNPFLKDSCHTHDGYVLYGETAGIKDSTYIDVVGGWHDASDYLQYATTSANATYHLLAAYRDFPNVFADTKQANGLDGSNSRADVLDEAKWGLDWLLKMHPNDNWLFNQVGDDRDHQGMRIPKQDSFYGKGYQRPVYFVSGEPQQRGKFMNNTTGTSSTAAKFASAFALGYNIFNKSNTNYAKQLFTKSRSAYSFAQKKLGVTQTASVRSPYIYAEENWQDDMELAATMIYGSQSGDQRHTQLNNAMKSANAEPVTPWLGKDSASHYQWYPFINPGHYELAKLVTGKRRDTIVEYYKTGIQKVWAKAKQNAFYRGIPFIWCSNNLTTSFATQCYWYRHLTSDKSFCALEQASIDWLFGCNPWGTSMVYGYPGSGDTPDDPHSAFTHLKKYPIDGGLVDGPVYTSIYKNLIGITLYQPDEYAAFQSDLAVYHDDYGDYSTNEPTMDGTASLIYLLAAKEAEASARKNFTYSHGAIIRGDSTKKNIALVFTGHEFADGADFVAKTLKNENVRASFFFTGDFYTADERQKLINRLLKDQHFLGNHSNHHLLYCDWNKRDSLLVNQIQFDEDLLGPYEHLAHLSENARGPGVDALFNRYFLPPYEWHNATIAGWTKLRGIELINFTPGTLSTADYTTPSMKNYRGSETIYQSILNYEKTRRHGLSGFILLLHIGTDPARTDKFYRKLPALIKYLKAKGYKFQTIDQLLKTD